MFLWRGESPEHRQGLPHARGGVSYSSIKMPNGQESSPRTWGCFRLDQVRWKAIPVFPTHVGVFLTDISRACSLQRLPHARGGVSELMDDSAHKQTSSPRTWGCFHMEFERIAWPGVFPTHVGVFLKNCILVRPRISLPHARGGVSSTPTTEDGPIWSSPRTWGCFQSCTLFYSCEIVFPTHVGVFPRWWMAVLYERRLPHACGQGKRSFLQRQGILHRQGKTLRHAWLR